MQRTFTISSRTTRYARFRRNEFPGQQRQLAMPLRDLRFDEWAIIREYTWRSVLGPVYGSGDIGKYDDSGASLSDFDAFNVPIRSKQRVQWGERRRQAAAFIYVDWRILTIVAVAGVTLAILFRRHPGRMGPRCKEGRPPYRPGWASTYWWVCYRTAPLSPQLCVYGHPGRESMLAVLVFIL